jgi:DNA polymerase (family 10)
VDFQIEKNPLAARDDFAHDRRAEGREGLQADLENAGGIVELIDEPEHVVARRNIEGDCETVTWLHDKFGAQRAAGRGQEIDEWRPARRSLPAARLLMDKFTVARALDEIARYIELSDPKPFRARAFENAARAVERLEEDLDELVASGKIYDVSGIGKGTGQAVEELVKTGSSKTLEELRAQYPPGIFDLLRVPKLGLKKIGQVYSELGIASLDELEEAAKNGSLAKLKGFGSKTADSVLKGIEFARLRQSNFLLPVGIEVGETLRETLAGIDEIEDAEISGSVRRRLETIRNVNIVIATKKPKVVVQKLGSVVADLEPIDDKTFKGVARSEVDVFFHLASPAEFGSELLRTTGSQEFVDAFGEIPKAAKEKDAFKAAKKPYVEPERRENADDLKAKKRPKLLELDDIRGTFHVHTTYSDGRNSMGEMLHAAKGRGWEYLGISDHSQAAYYAGGLNDLRLKQQHAEIASLEDEVAPMRVFRGTEADILNDGTMDYGAKILSRFDFVIASVHSNFNMSKDEMTERMLKALDDPHVTFIGHLTGRKLLKRDGYTVEYDRIFEKAGERGVMIEINGNPNRLDVDWRYVKRALDRGVVLSIHPDAHSVGEYNAMITGTWVARKAGLSKNEIFNARPVEEVAEFLASRKARRNA